MESQWLILAYTLPPEPSRKRVSAWRRLRKLGAVYLDQGVWFLPAATAAERVADVVSEIEREGGTAWSFRAEEISESRAAELARRYNAARTQEYAEVIGHCRRFLAHLERTNAAADYRFGKLEEFEQDLEKRIRLLNEVQERDLLDSPGREPAEAMVHDCREALDVYAEGVYLASAESSPD